MKKFAVCALFCISFLISNEIVKKSLDLKSLESHSNIVPVAIIGGGPAGLMAGVYASRNKLPTFVFGGKEIGGQMLQASYVENWPGKIKKAGRDMIIDLKKQARHFGAQLVKDNVKEVDLSEWPYTLTIDNGDKVKALSVVVATGGSQITPDIPGVKKYWSKGISVCTICDAPFDKGKDVAVIGGGDPAGDKALQLAKFANKVTMLVENSQNHASGVVKDYLKKEPKITVRTNVQVKEIVGDGQKVTGIKMINKKTNKESTLPVQSVYFALGFEPTSKKFSNWLETDDKGYIKTVGKTQQTTLPGVFAAGNVEDNRYQKVAVACGKGAAAGIDTIEFMQDLGVTNKIVKHLNPKLYQPPLPDEKELTMVKSERHFKQLLRKNKIVIADFYAELCISCKKALPTLKAAAHELHSRAVIAKIEIEHLKPLMAQYKVEKVPTLIIFKNGKEVQRITAITKEKIVEAVNKFE